MPCNGDSWTSDIINANCKEIIRLVHKQHLGDAYAEHKGFISLIRVHATTAHAKLPIEFIVKLGSFKILSMI